ncbi:MAG TPA: hypothetical protein VJP59_11070 [Gemmatimonadota bacterium]|nr:hypothetical protein [Gemmatimonadota bacterium]
MNQAWVATAALVLSACNATVSGEGISNVPGEEVWKTEIELQLGERAMVDDGRLEVTLLRVGVDEASLMVEGESGAREESVRTGTGGSLEVPPYEIRLLEVGIDDSARLQIRRQWGEYR